MISSLRTAVAVSLLAAAALARAAGPVAVEGVLDLAASATVEVARDQMSVTLSATRDGADAAAVQAALKQALEAALAEARKAARPGQLEVQTGNFSLFPRYNKQNVISGWQGSTELVLEGRDMAAIGALTGRITTMTLARVGFSLSRELREKLEADLASQAIARYRAKAADYAKLFGYAGYSVREVNVSATEPNLPQPMMRMSAAAAASAEQALPVEPGKGSVTITVTGSVQMTK